MSEKIIHYDFDGLKRLYIQSVLPQEGNIVTMTMTQEVLDAVKFSMEEIEQTSKPDYTVDIEVLSKLPLKRIELSYLTSQMIVKQLHEMDEQKKLQLVHLPLWSMFVDGIDN